MRRLATIYKNIFHVFYLLRRVSWLKAWQQTDKTAPVVVWIQQDWSWRRLKRHILSTELLNDLALLQAVVESGQRFSLRIGPGIGRITGKHIFYNISSVFNTFRLSNHAAPLFHTIRLLEEQGNMLYPSSYEVGFWENKAYMHNRFEELGIQSPKTQIFQNISEIQEPIHFPVLLKETHAAGSAGVLKINDRAELDREVRKRQLAGQNEFLLQQLLNIRKDLRVTFVGQEIVLFYWRINKSKEWQPTSTGHGSDVDFIFFPEEWKDSILHSFEKLNIRTGAFDITWQNDDLQTEPYILEVSPAFMPNPPMPTAWQGTLSYAAYKKKVFPKPIYVLDYIDLVFQIKKQVSGLYLKKVTHINQSL